MSPALLALALLLAATAACAELPSASEAAVSQALASGRPALIDLGSRACNACKEMAPVLEALAAEYRGKAAVLFIDVREDRAAGGRFRVQMIPTQIFFDAKGKEVKRHVGFMDREQIVRELQALGVK